MTLRFAIPSRSARVLAATAAVGLILLVTQPCTAAAKLEKIHKENKRADTRMIEGLESQWSQAMVKGDTVALEKLLADDFLGISSNGTLSDKKQYLHRLEIHQNHYSTFDLMDIKVRMQPMTAIVTSQARVTGALDGRPINGIFRYTKVYSRSQNGWRVLNFEATRVSGSHEDDTEMHGGMPLHANARPAQQ